MGKTTTVRLTQKEIADIQWLSEQLNLKEAQIIRLSIHRFAQYMRGVYEAERASAQQAVEHGRSPSLRRKD